MSDVVLTDDDYFEKLWQSNARLDYLETLSPLQARERGRMEQVARTEMGLSAERVREISGEALSARMWRGETIRILQDLALVALGPQGEGLSGLPVVMMPSLQFRAYALRTPKGSRAIVLNHAVIALLGTFVTSYLSYSHWHDKEPFCRDHSQEEFGLAMLGIARYIASGGNERWLVQIAPTLICPSRPDYDKVVITITVLGELFILLHEYGHVLLGHLEHARVRRTETGGITVEELERSRKNEYAADRFAVDVLNRHLPDDGRSAPFAVSVGIMFGLFDLCARIKNQTNDQAMTHPLPYKRWQKVKSRLRIEKGSVADRLDGAFDTVRRGLRLMQAAGAKT